MVTAFNIEVSTKKSIVHQNRMLFIGQIPVTRLVITVRIWAIVKVQT